MFAKHFLNKSRFSNKLVTRNSYFFASEPENEAAKRTKKKPLIVLTPKKLFVIGVTVSWLFIFHKWFEAKEVVRERAQEYYDKGGSVDVSVPEEYRKEYV